MNDTATQAFEGSFRGRLIRPADADYDSARALYNGMIDKRPALIARCADVADVIAAVNFGREQKLLVAIRGVDGVERADVELVNDQLVERGSPPRPVLPRV